jgi:hypothetical protein
MSKALSLRWKIRLISSSQSGLIFRHPRVADGDQTASLDCVTLFPCHGTHSSGKLNSSGLVWFTKRSTSIHLDVPLNLHQPKAGRPSVSSAPCNRKEEEDMNRSFSRVPNVNLMIHMNSNLGLFMDNSRGLGEMCLSYMVFFFSIIRLKV